MEPCTRKYFKLSDPLCTYRLFNSLSLSLSLSLYHFFHPTVSSLALFSFPLNPPLSLSFFLSLFLPSSHSQLLSLLSCSLSVCLPVCLSFSLSFTNACFYLSIYLSQSVYIYRSISLLSPSVYLSVSFVMRSSIVPVSRHLSRLSGMHKKS